MPVTIRNLEWLNHNSQRAYPVSAEADRVDVSGAFRLPNDFIVELALPVHGGMNVNTSRFFIRKIASYATGFSVTIGYAAESGDVDVAAALIARSSHVRNQVYNLGGIGDFADSRGHITIGNLSGIDGQPAGLFTFDFESTRLEVDTIRPQIRGLMSLQVQNGSELSPALTGRVRLVGGRNTRIRVETEEDAAPRIVIEAVEGEGLTDSCVCAEESVPIRTLNGITPDQNGNIQFLGNECLDIVEGDHILEFVDRCSQPCCGCDQLTAITEALEAFGEKATTLENFLVSLEARSTQMDMVVLGSRLSDRSCSTDCV